MFNNKGQVSIYFAFIVVAIIVVLVGAIFGPMGANFSTAMFVAGENILATAQSDINQIEDETIKTRINDTLQTARLSQENNIAVSSDLFKYSWIVILFLTALVSFLFTRRLVETGSGFV
jgi:uncharacterized protein (UPF0333 family)